MPDTTTFHSPAWILSGLHHTPGVLILRGVRLSFVTDDGPLFETPLGAISDIRFPWYEFTGGFRATIAGTRYRIALVRPNGATSVTPALLDDQVTVAGTALHDVAIGRKAGRTWRALLLDGPAATARAE